tara:strand:- start:2575 stop:4995 length:2421 start_codon:yes stop_codon:yes gene_type:complete
MSFKVTARTRSILNQIQKNPSVVIETEGVESVFSSSVVFEKIRWDSGFTWDQEGATWDGAIATDKFKSYINLKESTQAITQQIYPDKQGSSSITTMTFTLVDKNGEVAKAYARDTIGEVLGKKTLISLGFVGGVYPTDYMPVMNGIIVAYSYMGGSCQITISHADSLRRQAILTEYNSQLIDNMTSVQTTMIVESTANLLPSQDILKTYVKISDEIMSVVSIDSDTQLTVLRGELNTLEESHDAEDEVVSIYELKEYPLVLAQKIMQSNEGNTYFESDIKILNFNYVSLTESVQNSIIFETEDIERSTGLIENDFIEIDTYGTFTVSKFGKLTDGNSYITVNETLPEVIGVSQAWRFNSQFNTLNFGLDMKTYEVDNQEFEYIKNTFSPNFTEMTFRVSEGIENARDFINNQLFFVSGCYGIPRNARASVKFLSPPLTVDNLPTFNANTVNNLIKLRPVRSINKFYYNDILYAFNKSVKDSDYKSFSRFIDNDAKNNLGVGLKQLRIESDGLIRSNETDLIINRLANRFLDRYSGAGTFIKGLKLSLKNGFSLNIGDVILFGGENTKLVNYESGKRDFPIAKYEIINQKIDLKGEVVIDILSTNFSLTGTFGVFSPSSLTAAGSTTTEVILSPINNLNETDTEREKWEFLVGAKIRVRSEDYSYDYTTLFSSLSLQNQNVIVVDALPLAPPVNAIVELALYDEYETYQSNDLDDTIKLKYTFTMNQDLITVSIDNTSFEVANPTEFFVGQKIAVHSDDFTRDNFESTILTILGNIVTLEESLDFVPQVGDKIESRQKSDIDGYLFL